MVPTMVYGSYGSYSDVSAEKVGHGVFCTHLLIRTLSNTRVKTFITLTGKINVYSIVGSVCSGMALRVHSKCLVVGISVLQMIAGHTVLIDAG